MDILVICDSFTKTLPTSMCLQAIVNDGVKRGHRCRIVSSKGVVFDSKISLEYKNSSDLNAQSTTITPYLRVRKIITPFLRYYTWPGEPFADLDSFYQIIEKEVESDSPDIVICSVGSLHNICIGSRIKEKFPEIKYVPYFLDSILGGAKLRVMPKLLHNYKAQKWEEKHLHNADSIVMMKYVEKKYRSLNHFPSYFNKIKFLDLPLYNPVKTSSERVHKYFPSDTVNMFFAGSMPKNIRDPKFIVNVFQKIKRRDVNLYIAGTSYYQSLLDKLVENDNRVHLLGVTPHEQVLEMMSEADILLSIGNKLECMIPCKIFEYMSTGKPIIATYKSITDPSIGYFEYYNNSLLLDEKMVAEDAAAKIETFLVSMNENPEIEIIKTLYGNTPAAFWEHISAL